MTRSEVLIDIAGVSELTDWFGSWPTFHDAEVHTLCLSRDGRSTLAVHAFRMTSNMDERGYFKLEKHVLVTFSMSEVIGLSLDDFNQQNVLSGLDIEKHGELYRLVLNGCYGVCGCLDCKSLTITFEPQNKTLAFNN